MRSTIIRTVALAALAGVTLVGCGEKPAGSKAEPGFTDKSVAEIEAAAIEDMEAATSLRLKGQVVRAEQTTTLDLALTTEGNCDGTISAGEGTASVRSVDGASYLKADEAFWQAMAGAQAQAIIALIGDKWAKLPNGGGEFASFCDLDQFLDELGSDDLTDATVGETKEIDGVEAIEISGDGESGGTLSFWVSTADPHHILSIAEVGGTEPAEFTFSDFNEAFDITAPEPDEVVDLGAM